MRFTFAVSVAASLVSACVSSPEPAGGPPADDPFFGDAGDALDAALDFIATGDAHRISATDEILLGDVSFDRLGHAHVRIQQTYAGVPVFGREAIVHLAGDDEAWITDHFAYGLRLDPIPDLTSEEAAGIALLTVDPSVGLTTADLEVLRRDGDHLVWVVRVAAFDGVVPAMPVVFVDAHDGSVVWSYDDLQTARNRKTYDAKKKTILPGTLIRDEASAASGDVPLDDAHDFAGATYDYYFNEQGRDSYNGLGANMVASVHYSTNYDNAFWSGTQTVFGDGGFVFVPLSQGVDVVGHEFSHGVTQTSANLIYSNESGGLNEGTSDILGAVIESFHDGWIVDPDTWMVGEDIMKFGFGAALRFMDDPPADGASIDDYADYFNGLDVHYSSGLANKAFYLMEQDAALDIQGAADIWYTALTAYMTAGTTFHEGRVATESAASDLFGAGSPEELAVGGAWDGVGVFEPLPEVCDDGLDNDFDTDFDCDDGDCSLDVACALSCPGGEFSGTLSTTNKADFFKDAIAQAGHFEADLSGDAGTNFNLRLEALQGGSWILLVASTGPTSDEHIAFDDGTVRTHRWKVQRKTGTGAYTLCVQ